ncbi:DUF1254 domain-containing protein [Burkholderia guangdongensis]|uniref:DUF1254 domain-containing protein n=1 Tax=Burkholderia guangdongensis TaxID=1792500 RepID=UPI0015C992F4|nr:DUF1254 domain-containing protein [Burkholderia guangdongensis]
MSILDTLDAAAADAVQFALPLYEMSRMRSATAPRADHAGRFAGDSPESTLRWANLWSHTRRLLGPQDRKVVTPNNDTLYSSAWLDLSRGPLVLRVPAMGERYYVLGLLDMYTNPFGYVGTRTTGRDAGAFLVHGPGWRGDVPDGMRALACPTDAVWMIGRMLVDDDTDLAAAVALQDQLTIEPAPGSDAQVPCRIDTGMQPNERLGDPEVFARVVNRALAGNPPPADEASLVARFAACGIGAALDGVPPTDAQRDALARAIRDAIRTLSEASPSTLGGGWALPVDLLESFGTDYRQRARTALSYIGALGIREAMYLMADRDADGALLDGHASYVLHFPPGGAPRTDAFWSLTAYERESCMLADNAIGRYSLGDRTPGLQHDADGGLRIAMSAREPADPVLRRNWLPAPPGRFYLALRLYVPGDAHIERRFAYPPIERQCT